MHASMYYYYYYNWGLVWCNARLVKYPIMGLSPDSHVHNIVIIINNISFLRILMTLPIISEYTTVLWY